MPIDSRFQNWSIVGLHARDGSILLNIWVLDLISFGAVPTVLTTSAGTEFLSLLASSTRPPKIHPNLELKGKVHLPGPACEAPGDQNNSHFQSAYPL